MLDGIREAEHTVDMLTYVYWTGDIARRFAAALCERAQAGVRGRILLDAIGAALWSGVAIGLGARAPPDRPTLLSNVACAAAVALELGVPDEEVLARLASLPVPATLRAAVLEPAREFFGRPQAVALLVTIVLYKLGDAFAGALSTTFLIRGAGYGPAEVGLGYKRTGLLSAIA